MSLSREAKVDDIYKKIDAIFRHPNFELIREHYRYIFAEGGEPANNFLETDYYKFMMQTIKGSLLEKNSEEINEIEGILNGNENASSKLYSINYYLHFEHPDEERSEYLKVRNPFATAGRIVASFEAATNNLMQDVFKNLKEQKAVNQDLNVAEQMRKDPKDRDPLFQKKYEQVIRLAKSFITMTVGHGCRLDPNYHRHEDTRFLSKNQPEASERSATGRYYKQKYQRNKETGETTRADSSIEKDILAKEIAKAIVLEDKLTSSASMTSALADSKGKDARQALQAAREQSAAPSSDLKDQVPAAGAVPAPTSSAEPAANPAATVTGPTGQPGEASQAPAQETPDADPKRSTP